MSSAYWYSLMYEAQAKKERIKTQMKEYESYKQTLNSLNNNILQAIEDIDSAKKNYADGGYISAGETLDRGVLKSCSEVLTKDYEIISGIISNTGIQITNFEQSIIECNNLYSYYKSQGDYAYYQENSTE